MAFAISERTTNFLNFFHFIFPICRKGEPRPRPPAHHHTERTRPGGGRAEAAASNQPLSSAASTDHGHGRLLPAVVGVPCRRLPQDLHLPQGLLHRYVSLPPLRRHLVLGGVACRFLRSGAWDHGSLLLIRHALVGLWA